MTENNDAQVQGVNEAVAPATAPAPAVAETANANANANVAPITAAAPYDGKFKELEDISMVQETQTIKDKETNEPIADVTFSFPGVDEATRIADLLDKGYSYYADELLRKAVAAPAQLRANGLKFFNTHAGMQEVLTAADRFLVDTSNRVSNK